MDNVKQLLLPGMCQAASVLNRRRRRSAPSSDANVLRRNGSTALAETMRRLEGGTQFSPGTHHIRTPCAEILTGIGITSQEVEDHYRGEADGVTN